LPLRRERNFLNAAAAVPARRYLIARSFFSANERTEARFERQIERHLALWRPRLACLTSVNLVANTAECKPQIIEPPMREAPFASR
jgi:hypothetical protein